MRQFLAPIALALVLTLVGGCEDDSTGPPRDLVAPSPVTDLRIESDGAVPATLSVAWTAPGDDADVGTASAYDLRVSDAEIDATNFALATALLGVASPGAAGSVESFVLPQTYQTGTWYLALRTADEASNWSALSNVVATSDAHTGFDRPTTPQAWAANFERAHEELNLPEYDLALHEDFTFWFAPEDIFQTGSVSWTRAEDLASAANMFSGEPGSQMGEDGEEVVIPAIVDIDLFMVQNGEWTEDFDDGSEFAEADVKGRFSVSMIVRYTDPGRITQVAGEQFFYLKRTGVQIGELAQDVYDLYAWKDTGTGSFRALTDATSWGEMKNRFRSD